MSPDLIMFLLNVLYGVVFVDAITSWFMSEDQFPRNVTRSITDPLYAPIRAIVGPDKLGGIDISPFVMFLLIRAMQNMLIRANLV